MGQSGATFSMEKSVILTTRYWNQLTILFQAGYQAESTAAMVQSFFIPEFSLSKPEPSIPHHSPARCFSHLGSHSCVCKAQ